MTTVLVRFLCLLAVLLSFSVQAAGSACRKQHCLAVVDSGSTGSRLHIYAFDLDKTKTAVNIKELWSRKINPGFASLSADQQTVNSYLDTLFSQAPEKNLSVYFYATAGMRLLPQPKQQQMYNLLHNWFAGHSEWVLQSAKTITGTEEGAFGWLSVNYQLGTLESNEKEPAGVIDIGGASTQISFPVEQTEVLEVRDVQQINVYGRQIKLFTHSFLGLGQTEVSHQFLDTAACYSNQYELPMGAPAVGDAYSCASDIASLMNEVHHVNRIVQPAIAANPVSRWIAMGGVADLVQSQPFQFTANQFSNESLLDQANTQVCHQQWTDLSQQFPNDDYLYGYCLFPSYYYALMVDGYGIKAEETITVADPTKNGDWTLGVVLHQQA